MALPPAQGRSVLCHLGTCLTPCLSMFRAAACADAGGESNSYIDGTRRGAWSGRAPQSISTGDVRKKGDSPKEKVDFLWGSPKGHSFGDHQRAGTGTGNWQGMCMCQKAHSTYAISRPPAKYTFRPQSEKNQRPQRLEQPRDRPRSSF